MKKNEILVKLNDVQIQQLNDYIEVVLESENNIIHIVKRRKSDM
jgi:hypothetical protein